MMQQSNNKNLKQQPQKKSGIVRIIGGTMRGRKLNFHAVDGLRPSLDRIRETLFNWLQKDITDSYVLDLFAGSGALGFEAISRHAKHVTLVEKNKQVSQTLKKNCQQLNINNIDVINDDAIYFLNNHKNKKYDIIFLDPPFGKKLLEKVFPLIESVMNDKCLVYIEQEKSNNEFKPPTQFEALKYKQTSRFSYALYQFQIIN